MSMSGKFYMREHSSQIRIFSRRRLRLWREDTVAEDIKGLLRVVMVIICRNRQRLLSQAWERWIVGAEILHDYDSDMKMILGRQIDADEKRSELEIEVMFKWCIQKFRVGTLGLAHLVATSRSKVAVVAALQQCRLEIYAAGETVYLQGDLPRAEDGQFTVLKGVCEFISFDKESLELLELRSLPEGQRQEESRRILKYGRKIDEVRASNGFGELSSSMNVKRASSVRAGLDSPVELIVLPKRCVAACQRVSTAPRIAEAMDFLRETSMAHDVPFHELCIGAQGMTKKIMRMGTILYRMGDVVDRVYLVVSGDIMLDTDFESLPPKGGPITFQNLNPDKCYCLSEQSILGDEGLCGFSTMYESTAVVVSDTAIVFEVVGGGISFLLRRFEVERYSALAYKDQTMLSPPMKVFENIELLHSAFSSLRRAIGLHQRDRGVKKTTESEALQVAKQQFINTTPKAKISRAKETEGPGAPPASKVQSGSDIDIDPNTAETDQSKTESEDGHEGHAVLSRHALQHALRVKKLVDKRLVDEHRALAKERILAHEIIQASATNGRSRFTAQAEDKVERALSSFYARRIEIRETESAESNKLRLADVHRNMNLLMAAAASALERGNMDIQVIPRASNDDDEEKKEHGCDPSDDDASGSRDMKESGVDVNSADAPNGSLRKSNFDSDDESLESEDTRILEKSSDNRKKFNGPLIVKHFFELISENERKIKSLHRINNLQSMLQLPLPGLQVRDPPSKPKSPKAAPTALLRRNTAAFTASPHLLRSPISRPLEARGTVMVSESSSLIDSVVSSASDGSRIPALIVNQQFAVKSNFCRVMTNRARRTQALLHQEWQNMYGYPTLLSSSQKRGMRRHRKMYANLVSSISLQRSAQHESSYLPETKKELLTALRSPAALGPRERARFVSSDITPRFLRIRSDGSRPQEKEHTEGSDDDSINVTDTFSKTGTALLGMDAVNSLSSCIEHELALRERFRHSQNTSSAILESDSVVSAAHKVMAQRRKKYLLRQLQTIPRAPSRRVNLPLSRRAPDMPSAANVSNESDENINLTTTRNSALDTTRSGEFAVTEGSISTNIASGKYKDTPNSDVLEEGSLDSSSLRDGSIEDAESNGSVGLLNEDVRSLEKRATPRPRKARGSISTESRRPSRGTVTTKSQADLSRIESSSFISDHKTVAQKSKSITKGAAASEKESKPNEHFRETEDSIGQTDRDAKTPSTDAGDAQAHSRQWNRLKTAIHTSYLLSTDRIAKNFERVYTTEAKTCRYLDGKKKTANESRFALRNSPSDGQNDMGRKVQTKSAAETDNDTSLVDSDSAVVKWRQCTVQEIFDTRRGPQVSLPVLAATGSNSIYWSHSSSAMSTQLTSATGALSYVQVLTKSRIDDAAKRRQRINNKKS